MAICVVSKRCVADAGIEATVFISASNGRRARRHDGAGTPRSTRSCQDRRPASTAAVAIAATANIERIVSFDMGLAPARISRWIRRGVAEFTNQTTGRRSAGDPAVGRRFGDRRGRRVDHPCRRSRTASKWATASAGAAPGPAAVWPRRREAHDHGLLRGQWLGSIRIISSAGGCVLDRELARGGACAPVAPAKRGHADLSAPESRWPGRRVAHRDGAQWRPGMTRHLAQKGSRMRAAFRWCRSVAPARPIASFSGQRSRASRASSVTSAPQSTFCALGAITVSASSAPYAASLGADRQRSGQWARVWPPVQSISSNARREGLDRPRRASSSPHIAFEYSADMRYRGQAFNIEVTHSGRCAATGARPPCTV